MDHIRPFTETDVPQVASLHRAAFKTADRVDSGLDAYRAYFDRVFLANPVRDAKLPSLVYEEKDGTIVGFLGVVPRRMTISGHQFRAAISSQCVVDPSCQASVVTVRLAKAFLEGEQDISISDDANDTARKIWEGLGGMTSLWHSIYWTRPLRPARFALRFLANRRSLAPLTVAAAAPLARVADAIATSIPRSHLFHPQPQGFSSAELSEQVFLSHLPEFAGVGSLRMEYDEGTFQWLIELARRRKPGGHLHTAVIKKKQTVLGWYLFHMNGTEMAEVLQIAADVSAVPDVLDHLFYDAARQRAIALTGRLEPRFLQALSDKHCVFHRRGPWVLVCARRSDIIRWFQTGDTFFSRFDGEWCLGF